MTERMSFELNGRSLDIETWEAKGHIPRQAQNFAVWGGIEDVAIYKITCYWDDPKYGTTIVITIGGDHPVEKIKPNLLKRDTDVTLTLPLLVSDQKFSSPNGDGLAFLKFMGDLALKSLKV